MPSISPADNRVDSFWQLAAWARSLVINLCCCSPTTTRRLWLSRLSSSWSTIILGGGDIYWADEQCVNTWLNLMLNGENTPCHSLFDRAPINTRFPFLPLFSSPDLLDFSRTLRLQRRICKNVPTCSVRMWQECHGKVLRPSGVGQGLLEWNTDILLTIVLFMFLCSRFISSDPAKWLFTPFLLHVFLTGCLKNWAQTMKRVSAHFPSLFRTKRSRTILLICRCSTRTCGSMARERTFAPKHALSTLRRQSRTVSVLEPGSPWFLERLVGCRISQ